MNYSDKGLPAAGRTSPADAGFEWEVLPSLAHLLAPAGSDPVWEDTKPAAFDLMSHDQIFQALPGLEVHQVTEPEIFRLFFDTPAHPEPGAHA